MIRRSSRVFGQVALIVLLLCAVAIVSPAAHAADFYVFGRVASSDGLGVSQPSLGFESRVTVADVIVTGMVSSADKVDGDETLFFGGSLEYRRSVRNFVFGARWTHMQQSNEFYSKTASYPSLRVGYMPSKNYTVLLSYSASDGTENQTQGLGLALEALTRPFSLIAEVEQVSFIGGPGGPSQSGTRMALCLGWKF